MYRLRRAAPNSSTASFNRSTALDLRIPCAAATAALVGSLPSGPRCVLIQSSTSASETFFRRFPPRPDAGPACPGPASVPFPVSRPAESPARPAPPGSPRPPSPSDSLLFPNSASLPSPLSGPAIGGASGSDPRLLFSDSASLPSLLSGPAIGDASGSNPSSVPSSGSDFTIGCSGASGIGKSSPYSAHTIPNGFSSGSNALSNATSAATVSCRIPPVATSGMSTTHVSHTALISDQSCLPVSRTYTVFANPTELAAPSARNVYDGPPRADTSIRYERDPG
ncbi:hypothetical protein GCM10009565_53110 [Amycolatopsis albidoflavus]